jgi:hypothetical protein
MLILINAGVVIGVVLNLIAVRLTLRGRRAS